MREAHQGGGRQRDPQSWARCQKVCWEGQAMTIHDEMEITMGATIPAVVKSMGGVATDAKTSTTTRMKAIDLLLRVAMGEPSDVVTGRNARTALSQAEPFLQEIVTSHKSFRIRSQAAKLADSIRKLGK
jgi:hypothetical protein